LGSHPLVTVSDDRLLISAMKKAEKGPALILRIYNPGAGSVEGARLQFGRDIDSACLTDFAEHAQTNLTIKEGGTVLLPAIPAYTARTIEVIFTAAQT
jgi:alpha-mannosidase